MTWETLIAAVLLLWLLLGLLAIACSERIPEEVPPVEERPTLPPEFRRRPILTPDRVRPSRYWAGKTVEQICRELEASA